MFEEAVVAILPQLVGCSTTKNNNELIKELINCITTIPSDYYKDDEETIEKIGTIYNKLEDIIFLSSSSKTTTTTTTINNKYILQRR